MISDEEIKKMIEKTITENKLNKINDKIYLSNRQIDILDRYNINYANFKDIKALILEIEQIIDDGYGYDDLEGLSMELAEFNYYHYTNK